MPPRLSTRPLGKYGSQTTALGKGAVFLISVLLIHPDTVPIREVKLTAEVENAIEKALEAGRDERRLVSG